MDDKKMAQQKTLIRSVLLSCKEGIKAKDFLNDYSMIAGEFLNFKALGFKTVDAFMRSIPDVVEVRSNYFGELEYHGVADASTAHIKKMVQAQKSGKKTKKLSRPNKMKSTGSYGRGGSMQVRHWPSNYSKKPQHQPFRRQPFHPSSYGGGGGSNRGRGGGGFHGKGSQRGRGIEHFAHFSITANNQPFNQDFKKHLPPRFQKQKPVAVVSPSSSTSSLHHGGHSPARGSSPQNGVEEEMNPQKLQLIKNRVVQLLESHPKGVWSARLLHMYEKKHGPSPPQLMKLVQGWRDVIIMQESQSGDPLLLAKKAMATQEPKAPQARTASSSAGSQQASNASCPALGKTPILPIPIPASPWTGWKDVRVARSRMPELEMRTQVFPCFVRTLGDFYVHSARFDPSSSGALLHKTASSCPAPKAADLRRNMFCTARFSEDEAWYRARIIDLPYKAAKVHFIDFGNGETVPYGSLRPLPPEASHPPAQAIHCCLARIVPKGGEWTEEAAREFERQVVDQELDMVVQEVGSVGSEETAFVDLYLSSHPDVCINDLLVEQGFADYLAGEEGDDVNDDDEDDDPPPLNFPPERYLPVYVCNISPEEGVLYVRLVGEEFSDKLDEFSSVLEDRYNSRPPMSLEDVEVSMVCVVKEEKKGDQETDDYHRCRVISKSEDMVCCALLDHGERLLVSPSKLRFLDAETNKMLPYQAVQCVLYDVELTPDSISVLEELAVGKTLIGDNAGMTPQDGGAGPLCLVLYDTKGEEDNINLLVQERLRASRGSPDRAVALQPDAQGLGSLRITVSNDQDAASSPQRTAASDAPPAEASRPLYTWSLKEGEAGATAGTVAGAAAAAVEAVEAVEPPSLAAGDAGTARVSPPRRKQWNPQPYFRRKVPARRQLPSFQCGQVGQASIEVIVIQGESPSNFVVLQHQDTAELDKLMGSLQDYFTNPSTRSIELDEEDVREGVLYAVVVENTWYRAIVEKIDHLGISIYLCDYGEHHLVQLRQLRPLPNKFWSTEQLAIKCRLHGVQPREGRVWSREARDTFNQMTHEDKVLFAIHFTLPNPDPEHTMVQLIDTSEDDDVVVADRLLELGLARRQTDNQAEQE